MTISKPFCIAIAIIAFGALAYNIYDDPRVSYLFGKELNDWVYRAFWLAVIGLCAYNFIYIERNTLKDRSKSKKRISK